MSVHVPAGAIITVSIYMTDRNPNLWTKPNRFDPARRQPARAGSCALTASLLRPRKA
jgi:cytochrome P450